MFWLCCTTTMLSAICLHYFLSSEHCLRVQPIKLYVEHSSFAGTASHFVVGPAVSVCSNEESQSSGLCYKTVERYKHQAKALTEMNWKFHLKTLLTLGIESIQFKKNWLRNFCCIFYNSLDLTNIWSELKDTVFGKQKYLRTK